LCINVVASISYARDQADDNAAMLTLPTLFQQAVSISMNFRHTLYIVSAIALLAACAPHPGAGVWKSTGDNSYGITELTLGFDGKAGFDTTKYQPASWRCFWSAAGEHAASLECSASTSTERKQNFRLILDEQGPTMHQRAELRHDGQLAAVLERHDQNPVIE